MYVRFVLMQMAYLLPRSRSISEPYGYLSWRYQRRHMTFKVTEQYEEKLIRDCHRLTLKVEPDEALELDRLIVKMNPSCTQYVPLMRRITPRCTVILNTRHPKPSMKSFKKIMFALVKPHHYYYRKQFRCYKLNDV